MIDERRLLSILADVKHGQMDIYDARNLINSQNKDDHAMLEEAIAWIVDNMTCDIPKDELERANRIIERAEGRMR